MWFFFFNDTATTEIYTLSLHDALPISVRQAVRAHKTWGAAAMKVWYIMPPQPPDSARVSNLMRVAGDEARKVGLPLIVHATGLWEAKDALRAGARVLVHSVWSAPVDDEFLALARSR